jgi:D-glycero-D-manno-heptose 1,7-bisphosphate phosphatase
VVRAVFLDRDGVINANLERNGKPVAPTTLEQFSFLPGVEEAVGRLKAAGFAIVVVTNQPDIKNGLTTMETLLAMHAQVRRRLTVDDIKVCLHVDADKCECRKPKPGMLLEAAAQHQIDLPKSYLVGDRWRDIQAGAAAGCLTIFVDYDYPQDGSMQPDWVVRSLPEAVAIILDQENR